MKTILFAAALSISSIALAQSTTTGTQSQPQPSGETVDDPSQSTGPQGITQQGTDPNGQATAPAGTNQTMPMQTTPMQAMQSRPAAGEYPPCSRSVTDSCVQTYERGVRRGPRRR
jgi:hypothetical protein